MLRVYGSGALLDRNKHRTATKMVANASHYWAVCFPVLQVHYTTGSLAGRIIGISSVTGKRGMNKYARMGLNWGR